MSPIQRSLRCLAVVLLVVFGCAPADDLGPQWARVLAPDEDTKEYYLTDALLETLESARKVRGGVARLRGGGTLMVEDAVLAGQLTADSEEELTEHDLILGDERVHAEYEKHDGVLVPSDFETLLLFSYYHHVERGYAFFEDLGFQRDILGSRTTFFNTRFSAWVGVWGQPLVTDNAGYTPVVDGFIMFPSTEPDDGIPLSANAGVVVHELTHALKHHLIHGDGRVPIYVRDDWPKAAVSAYRADDEGISDFIAAVFMNDPRFIDVSIDDERLDRDLDEERLFTQDQYDDLDAHVLSFNPYSLGSSLASWLWATAGLDRESRMALARIVLSVVRDEGPTFTGDYRLTQLLEAILAAVDADTRERGCRLLDLRLRGDFRNVPLCGI